MLYMLSIQECRDLIPDSEVYSDGEIAEIRDDLASFAEIIFESWLKEQNKPN